MALDPATRQKVIDLYRGGKKAKDIIEETGVARSTLYHVLEADGIKPQASRGGKQPEPPLDRDLVVHITDPKVGSQLVDALLKRTFEQEREIGRLQAILQYERWLQQNPSAAPAQPSPEDPSLQ